MTDIQETRVGRLGKQRRSRHETETEAGVGSRLRRSVIGRGSGRSPLSINEVCLRFRF